MDPLKLTELLRNSIEPNPEQRKGAEDQLSQVSECPWMGFGEEQSEI